MRWRRHLRMSARELGRRPLRAALAVATIAVGTAAVILTAALSEGVQRQVAGQLDRMGTNLLVVRPAQVPTSPARPAIRGSFTTLTVGDADAIARAPGVALVAPATERRVRARSDLATAATSVLGTSAAFQSIRNVTVTRGRFLSAADDADAARVAVLGARIAQVLFADRDPIDASITLGGVPFDVVGVLQVKGVAADGSDQDGQVVVPVRTAMRRLNNVTWVTEIFVRAEREDQIPLAEKAIATTIEARHGRIDFDVQNTASLVSRQSETIDSLDLITRGVAAITVAIGGGGIVALMLLSATERTSEIGLRMAVGAMRRDIVLQFVVEAGALSTIGWVAGALAGVAAAMVAAQVTAWPVAVPAGTVAWSLALVAAGPAAGVLPAQRASRIPPMQALLSR